MKMQDNLPVPTVSIKLLTLKIREPNQSIFGACFFAIKGSNLHFKLIYFCHKI